MLNLDLRKSQKNLRRSCGEAAEKGFASPQLNRCFQRRLSHAEKVLRRSGEAPLKPLISLKADAEKKPSLKGSAASPRRTLQGLAGDCRRLGFIENGQAIEALGQTVEVVQ